MEKEKDSAENSRRDFLKMSGMIGSAALMASPVLAMAAEQMGGKPADIPSSPPHKEGRPAGGPPAGLNGRPALPDFKPDEIGKALKVLYKTYSNTRPYQHKFNDALTKAWLNSIDFVIMKGNQKEFIEHYVNMMMPILSRGKVEVATFGKDAALTNMFDGTMCSIQLFEEITIKENERTFPCPYKSILEVCKPLKMFNIEWKQVCENLCTPLYTGFGKAMGVDVTITPGEICTAKV